MAKRSEYIDERERELIDIIYRDYFNTFQAAERLTYRQPIWFTKKIKKITYKALKKDIKRVKKALRKEKNEKLTPSQKRKRFIILISCFGAGIILIIATLLIIL